MNKTKSLFLPIVLTAFLLAGCKGAVITREEAVSRAAEIEEHYESADFEAPTKFTATQHIKSAFFDVQADITMVETLDLEGKYYYMSGEGTAGEESESSKMWIYYQASENKTYMVIDENGTKGHQYVEGDLFLDSIDLDGTAIANLYSDIGLSDLLSSLVEEDKRNVYRSSGEGSIYLKVFMGETDANAFSEIEIANYLIVRVYAYVDDSTEMEMNIKYSGISTSKPNLANYPLVS